MEWHVYLLDCDDRLYTGISTDPARRLQEHASGKARGAKFTRTASTLTLKYQVAIGDRSLASKVEARIKRLPRTRKLDIINDAPGREELLEFLDLQ
ncbi:MAG: GIY-YIG nuclease family protein [Gammaproteobacteria bacterium]|nr:GIY-YIG nuclease family protein [Gammaproteobacteria bacterium]